MISIFTFSTVEKQTRASVRIQKLKYDKNYFIDANLIFNQATALYCSLLSSKNTLNDKNHNENLYRQFKMSLT